MTPDSEWSRRELLKSVGTGAVALAAGAAISERISAYIVGADSDAGAVAASSVSETAPRSIDLSAHTPWRLVRGTFSDARVESLHARDDVAFVQPDRWLETSTVSSEHDPTVPWGVARIGSTVVQDAGRTASGVDIGVVTSSPGVNAGASTAGGIPAPRWIEVSRRVRVTGLRLRPRSHRW